MIATMRATAADSWVGLALGIRLFLAYNGNDMQIVRCRERGPGPRTFNPFDRSAWRNGSAH